MPTAKRMMIVFMAIILFLLKPFRGKSFSVPLSVQRLNLRNHMTSLRAKTKEDNDNDGHHNTMDKKNQRAEVTRRTLISTCSLFSTSLLIDPQPSNAGLVQFPCKYDLMNTYHLMRAGESLLESENILSTNPLFLTNRDDALSGTGIEQVEAACIEMIQHDVYPSVVKYSLAAKSIDTANIIATQMQVSLYYAYDTYDVMASLFSQLLCTIMIIHYSYISTLPSFLGRKK